MALLSRATKGCFDAWKSIKDWAASKVQWCRKHPQQTRVALALLIGEQE
jgi:hypothetical protein